MDRHPARAIGFGKDACEGSMLRSACSMEPFASSDPFFAMRTAPVLRSFWFARIDHPSVQNLFAF